MAAKSGNAQLDEKIDLWLKWDRNEKTLQDIKDLVNAKNFSHLDELLMDRLTFGTSGIRGKMQAGFMGMNDLLIVQTAQGLLKYLEQHESKLLQQNGIAIGYDARHNSKRFAELTAAIFLHKNYPVRLFSDFVPTPFVPFSVTKFKCAAGVMVTASHNPKEDNGYKVYSALGISIIPPTDTQIQDEIIKNLEPLESSWNTDILKTSKQLSDPRQEVLADYVQTVDGSILEEHRAINKKSNFKITYSAMHGVGYQYVQKVFDVIGVTIIPVQEQKDPHPDFPTVKFPNPEEGKSSLDLSFKTADSHKCQLILANDPDADRLAAAEKDLSTGQWKVFNGNELGALLGWWCFHCFQTKYPNKPLQNAYMLASTVSSKILKSMGQAEGFNFIETLTGFKWLGSRSHDLLKQNKKVVFAFEEAIGFMCGSSILDKDGISAGSHLATMALYLHHHGLTLTQQLSEIYQVYGYHVSCNSYFFCNDMSKTKRIFERLRNYKGPNTYPEEIIDGKYKISGVRDLVTGYDSDQPDKKAILPTSKSSPMITFTFTNGLVATIRMSGTEPKIKYYTEMCASPSQQDRKEIEHTLKEMVDGIIFEFLQPVENNLIPKSD